MTDLPDATKETLRKLARSVASHRGGGGVLDGLPVAEQEMLQAMDEAQRRFFMSELAEAQAEQGRGRFRAELDRWRTQHTEAGSDPTTSR